VELAHYKDYLRSRWNNVKIVGVHTSGNGHYKVGQLLQVEAMVDLPSLKPEDVKVQLYAGPVNSQNSFEKATPITMEYVREMGPNRHLFAGSYECSTSGRQGYAVRIVPGNGDLATPFEPGLILWN
jgi:glycogen phosphorylase